MNKEQLMKKLDAAIDSAMRGRMYGKIEVEFNDGVPMFFRKLEQEKLSIGTRNRDQNEHSR
jgi:hypothetical protein